MILCFMSVMWNVCLNGLLKSLFCSIVLVEIRKSWNFPKFVNVEPCSAASLLVIFKGIKFGCRILISVQVGIIMIFDFAPEPIKKSISRSGGSLLFGLSNGNGMSKFFLLVIRFICFDMSFELEHGTWFFSGLIRVLISFISGTIGIILLVGLLY